MFYIDNTGWQLEGGVQNIDYHSVKVNHHSSTDTTWDVLDVICLGSGLHVGEGREKVQGGVSFHIIS